MAKIVTRSKVLRVRIFFVCAIFCVAGFFLFTFNPSTAEYSKQTYIQGGKETLATTTLKGVRPITTPIAVFSAHDSSSTDAVATTNASASPMYIVPYTTISPAAYDAKILALANLPKLLQGASTTASTTSATSTSQKTGPWPVWSAPRSLPGAILPFHRIVAYYGNLYSTKMGVLGKYPAPEMLARLSSTTAQWTAADPTTPAVPALDYIAVTAQASAGWDGKYRARMPASEIDKVLALAAQAKAIVILELQVGLSDVETELPLLRSFLKLPQVHLALDPEFSMHNGQKPGTVIGTMDAAEINYAARYLAQLVKENNLPPKVLIVHRFTYNMVTNTKKITPLPEVQIVMDMDGFGYPAKKIGTYRQVIISEPVQFTGFKLFYKNDVEAGHLMTPEEVLKLSPQPSFIQYQ